MASDASEGSTSVSPPSQSHPDILLGLLNSKKDDSALGAGEKTSIADAGSPSRHGELQHVVDLNHGAGMTGHVGQMSEVLWMQRAHEYLVGPTNVPGLEQTSSQVDHHSAQALTLTYFMDDENLLLIDEDHILPEQLPSREVALTLSEAYFHAAQGNFQFLRREWFLHELEKLITAIDRPSWAQRRTLGLVNIVWAVGAKWLEITQLAEQTLVGSHLNYYARARALGLDHRILFDHPDVEMTQAIGVLGFYLLINGSIQRSWSVIGQAIRHAIALGLHLKIHTGAAEEADREDRARLWCTLFQVENLLSEITGRSKCFRTAEVTLPPFRADHVEQTQERMKQELADELTYAYSRSAWQSTLGLHRGIALKFSGGLVPWDRFVPVGASSSPRHFTMHLRLSTISDEIATKLYAGDARMTWFEKQTATRALTEKLQDWHQSLPDELAVGYRGPTDSDPRSRLELVMYYQSVKMILFRPFLREIEILDESSQSMDLNKLYAKACVEAALNMLSTMPDDPVATEILQILPWWSLLHYVCQAAAILLLELCLGMQHIQGETVVVLSATMKALDYLGVLSKYSKSAYKAWNILRTLFQRAQAPYQHDIVPDESVVPPEPPNWDDYDRAMIQAVTRMLQ